MDYIYDFTIAELSAMVSPSYRATQIFQWLYQKYEDDFEKFSNLSKDMRAELAERFSTKDVKIKAIQESSDGSKKYLLEAKDGHTFEAVFLKMKDAEYDEDGEKIEGEKYTVCVSSQIGCKVGCVFCLTAKGGFVRNLTPGEIVYQVLAIKKDNNLDAMKRVNIVFMGMGEPLDNLDNVVKAIDIFTCNEGFAISPKRQTISTSGISPKIDRLGAMDLGVMLAISLHAVDDTTRESLIPMNKAFNIQSVIDAVKRFPIDTRKRVMFEYLVIDGVNDSLESAKKLVKLLNGIKAKVNLIYFNPHEGSPFLRPSYQKMVAFQDYLCAKGLLCTIRASKGLDISAACGQLREQCA